MYLVKRFFHVNCCGITHIKSLKSSDWQWHCHKYLISASHNSLPPFETNYSLNNEDSRNLNLKISKKVKCGHCRTNLPEHLRVINCDICKRHFHGKCCTTQKEFSDLKRRKEARCCTKCLSNTLPFSSLDNNDLYLELQSTPILTSDFVQATPSFSIQSLLDKMSGQNFDIDDFMSETITSNYLTPSQFLENKLSPNEFSMLHINIASLSKHMDELRNVNNSESPV